MKRLWILCLVLGFALPGCGSKYAGYYVGKQPQPNAPQEMRATVSRITLELKGNGRFIYQRVSMPYEGDWATEGGKIKLQIDSALGKAVIPGSGFTPTDIVLTPQEDGSLRVEDSFIGRDEVVILNRAAKPEK